MTILRGLPFPAYLAIPAAHFSGLKEIDTGPEHYAHALTTPRPDTAALAMGRAVDSLILTPESAEVVTYQGRKAGKAWKAFVAAHPSAVILSGAEATAATGMRDAVRAHPAASALLTGGEAQVSLTWTTPDGIDCKARLDYLRTVGAGHMVELKTTIKRGRGAVMREIAARLYYAQIAWYLDGLRANGFPAADARMVVVEKVAPHVVHVFRVGDGPLENGRRKVDGWLRKVAECQASGVWRDADESDLVLPAWVDGDSDEDVDMTGVEEVSDGNE